MSLINLVGNVDEIDKTLLRCLNSGYFHTEMSIHSTEPSHGFKTLEGENPYTTPLNSVIKLASELKIDLSKSDFDVNELNLEDTNKYIHELDSEVLVLDKQKHEIKENIYQHEQAIIQIKHLAGLNVSFDDIFACKYVKVRFGRLPYDSYSKLNYYDNKTFFFFPFDNDNDYYWGVYFAPATKIAVIDDIFTSLYFERMRVPDYAHGTPEIATANINAILTSEQLELDRVRSDIKAIKEKNEARIHKLFSVLKFMNETYNLRKNVAILNNRFYLLGFVPKVVDDEFRLMFNDLETVSYVSQPYDADPKLDPPVKLKNSKFSAPFEAFVNLYSLPSYNDIDPTSFMAITYTILFGIMFGDLGQGLLLAGIGFFLSKVKKISFGKILTRIGFSSAFFGTLYGSVFGYENLLDPFYKNIFGLSSKPIHVFDVDTTNMLLGAAVGIGALLIMISISINIFVGFKTKNYERAIFGHNGIAGLTLYGSVAFGAISSLILKNNIMSFAYVMCLIILPIILIFFREPLGKLIKNRKNVMPHDIGEFIIVNIFELFEYLLSYLSNTMSFLRVGGFILSHAGMMAVVMSLSEMTGPLASPFVIVIGNLFVMCLEGLIVGIQVLRLEFYEIFSRNYEGNGKPFKPATVSYKVDN